MQVYDSNRYIMADALSRFEQEFAAFTGARFCIGMGNGLDSLTAALRACGVSPGDEVIVPAHTYIATWLAVSHCGARVVPVEPDERTMNIDVSRIEPVVTPRTRVILPVHLYGQACDMTSIEAIAKKNNLAIIEDNAQAQGAKWMDRPTGSMGSVNATSFYPTKNLGGLGDGGAVTTADESKAAFIRRYRNYGFQQKNIAVEQGANTRLDEMQAAVLSIKLSHLHQWNEERRTLAALYDDALKNVGDLVLPFSSPEAFHVYHLYVIRTSHRDQLKSYLAAEGIETMVHYPVPPHLQKAYEGLKFSKGDFPLTERIAETALSLPLWPGLTSGEVGHICDAIGRFFKSGSAGNPIYKQ